MIKLSDFVASFLEEQGLIDIFLVPGGGAIHLLDSIGKRPKLNYYCCHHEQAVAMATEAYSRVKGGIGVSLVTTGPGGTNAITGVVGSWIDSVPHLIISGQAYLKQTVSYLKENKQSIGLRQLGVQEFNIIDLAKPITKYAVMIEKPEEIKYHLQKAVYIATTGRPGPVWVDIPTDVQMAMIDETKLEEFNPKEVSYLSDSDELVSEKVSALVKMLKSSKRPVIVAGQGVKISNSSEELINLVEAHNIPLLTARNANDMIDSGHELFIGRPGLFGDRPGNFAVQNSDLLIAIGTRLALAHVGYDYKDYARNAKKVIVDIDKVELEKFTVNPDIKVNCDAKKFIVELERQLQGVSINAKDWLEQCKRWKKTYPVCLTEHKDQKRYVNPYYFVDALSQVLKPDDVIVTDMGFSFQCAHQAFKVKKGQKFFTSGGLAAMGYGLPAAIGACIANNKKRVICLAGDGGLQMNLQELQTLCHHKLPIKLFVFSNKGYLTIKQTQERNFDGRLLACNVSTGLSFPDLMKVAQAYGIRSKKIENNNNLPNVLRDLVDDDSAIFCELVMDDNQHQLMVCAKRMEDGTFEKKPLEDMYPYLDREEFRKNMVAGTKPRN